MSLNKGDIHNIGVLLTFAFNNGFVKSKDDAKVLFILEEKLKAAFEEAEEPNGNNVQDSAE